MHEASERKNVSDFINYVLTWCCEATAGKLQEVGLDDPQRSLPTPTILWLCDSVILWKLNCLALRVQNDGSKWDLCCLAFYQIILKLLLHKALIPTSRSMSPQAITYRIIFIIPALHPHLGPCHLRLLLIESAQVGRDLQRLSGAAFCGKGSLDEII